MVGSKLKKMFEFVERVDEDFTAVRITSGKFSGIVVVFGRVGFSDEATPEMYFDYQVLHNPKEIETDNQEFHDEIGTILHNILLEEVQKGTFNGVEFISDLDNPTEV